MTGGTTIGLQRASSHCNPDLIANHSLVSSWRLVILEFGA